VLTAIVASPTRTNVLLADAWRALGVNACVLWPNAALEELRDGDVALFRLDVLPTLDGVEPGLQIATTLEHRGIRVLNRPLSLLAAHDKLVTAQRLTAAGIEHPATVHIAAGTIPEVAFPCVLKPRFGSWGQDVFLCRAPSELHATLRAIEQHSWWRRHGALLQQLVGPVRRDLRLIVAGETVVAGAERMAAWGEWRTNVSLGGRVRPARLPRAAQELAVQAARAIGIDFAGVDLLPLNGDWIVLELNGAVDFDARYTVPGRDPYAAILDALDMGRRKAHASSGVLQPAREEETMVKTVTGKPARPGDEIVITGHSVGDSPRTAVIEEVLGEPGHERFRVRWEDGHESIYFPGEDAVLRRPAGARARSRA
jgi:ribosomal protein S6--L-glutamate ligase